LGGCEGSEGPRTGAIEAGGSRKVRAPQGRVPGNTRAAKADGKCHREQTASSRVPAWRPVAGKGETVG